MGVIGATGAVPSEISSAWSVVLVWRDPHFYFNQSGGDRGKNRGFLAVGSVLSGFMFFFSKIQELL